MTTNAQIELAFNLFNSLDSNSTAKRQTSTVIRSLVNSYLSEQLPAVVKRAKGLHVYDNGLSSEMRRALENGSKLQAVKLIKNATGDNLMNCKKYIENHPDFRTYYVAPTYN